MQPVPPFLLRTDSPIGRIEVVSDGRSIVSLAIAHHDVLPHDDLPERPTAVLDEAARQLDGYFDGSRRTFELPLALTGTVFRQQIWQRLRGLGWGEAISYGALGSSVGRSGAGRPIGGAVGANPVPIIVGCHRVLASDGRITGYSGGEGIPTKVWLLDHEGIEHR